MKPLSPIERHVLQHYRNAHGRKWKQQLNHAWMTGRDAEEPNGDMLRYLRNARGPTWLVNLRLDQEIRRARLTAPPAPK